MLDTLKERPDAGEHIERSRWPRNTAHQGVNNLWRYEIERNMRMSYMIRLEGDVFTVLVIAIFLTHKRYERRFGY